MDPAPMKSPIRLYMSMSLDGFIAGPTSNSNWSACSTHRA
jgi:hypothetical protein